MSGDVLIARFVLAVAVLLILARTAGNAARRVRQPRVIGEVVAGLLIGPAVLGAAAPDVRDYVLPDEVLPLVTAAATLGLVVFMFLTGVEAARSREIGAGTRTAGKLFVLSVANFGLPFAAGIGVAAALKGPFGAPASSAAFFPFIGVALAVSALPVLARILQDRVELSGFHGPLAIAAAANGDIAAWSILGVATGLARQESTGQMFGPLAAAAIGVLAVSFGLVARPRAANVGLPRFSRPGRLIAIVAGILLTTYATEAAGIGLVFGSFLLGIVVAKVLPDTVGDVADLTGLAELFLPLYFVETGARADIRLLGDPVLLPIGLALICVAISSKVGAALAAARLSGLTLADGLTLGVLLNTRGLTELIVLNVGMSAGIISGQLFTLFVIMALVTTALTVPLLDLLQTAGARSGQSIASMADQDEAP